MQEKKQKKQKLIPTIENVAVIIDPVWISVKNASCNIGFLYQATRKDFIDLDIVLVVLA